MCDFCGCRAIEPFASLTDDHATLEVLAELFDEGADPLDLEALRVSWEDHRATQAAVHSLARSLDLTEALEAGAGEDARLDALLAEPAPDGLALRRAVQGHIESWGGVPAARPGGGSGRAQGGGAGRRHGSMQLMRPRGTTRLYQTAARIWLRGSAALEPPPSACRDRRCEGETQTRRSARAHGLWR